MTSSGKSLTYSRESVDDEDEHSDVSRSRSGDDRRQINKTIKPDAEDQKKFLEDAKRERQKYDEDLRRQQ